MNVGKWIWRTSKPVPDWEMLRTAKIWKNPAKNLTEFLQQLKTPMRQFKEIPVDSNDCVMVQIGTEGTAGSGELFCAYPTPLLESEGAEIPAAALEMKLSAMLIRTNGLPEDHSLPPQVLSSAGEGLPCLLWGTEKGVSGVMEELKKAGAYSEVHSVQLFRKSTVDPFWSVELMVLLGNVQRQTKVCVLFCAPRRA